MQKLIYIALLFVTALFAQQALKPKAKVLTRADFDALLAHPDKVLLIDVRRPDEVSSNGGFPVYLSIQAGELVKHLDEIPKDRIIITVSNHAARGGKAADLLSEHGFNVAGTIGAETYASEGGTLTKIPVPEKKNQPQGESK